jgi:predicted metal-dependent phosphoesterase TrpH
MSPVDRRALLLAGAGVVTAAPLAVFAPAEAGRTRTKTFTGEFTSPDTPDWHYLPFRVPEGVEKISVTYRYKPTETGLGLTFNVVDIGIFDPSGRGLGNAEGFRGWSGGARRSFHLSRTHATPGYLPGPITPGVWRIALGPYLITPPGTPYKVEVTLHFGRRGEAFTVAPAPTEVPGRGPGWYRADLHTHTYHSDGSRTRRELAASAREAGLDVVGSTEHNTSSATLSWGRHAPDDLLVVAGEEVTTRGGHWLALGIPAGTWIDWRYRAADGVLSHVVREIHAVGGLAVAAHPSAPCIGCGWKFGFADLDAVEVWNGPWTLDDEAVVATWDNLLVAGARTGRWIPAVGNSDAHSEPQVVGLPHNVAFADGLDRRSILAAVRAGRTWIAESAAVDLQFTAVAGNRQAGIGERLNVRDDAPVTVTLTVTGAPGSVVRLVTDQGMRSAATLPADGPGTVFWTTTPQNSRYVRAEVRRRQPTPTTADTMVALTNPIFLGRLANRPTADSP